MKDIKNFILEEYRKNLEIKRIEESVYLKKFIDNIHYTLDIMIGQ